MYEPKDILPVGPHYKKRFNEVVRDGQREKLKSYFFLLVNKGQKSREIA